MIPARNVCQPGWITEYIGYLAADRYYKDIHKRTEFVCMDGNAEPSPHSSPINEDGVLFYPAMTKCGSLPCLPYVNNMDLTCVVCTR